MFNMGYRRQNTLAFWSSVVSNHSSETRRSYNELDQYPSRPVGNGAKPVTSSKYRVLSRLSCNVIWLPHECVRHLGLVETGWPRRGRCCRIERDKSATWQRRPNFFHKQEYIVDLKSSWRVLRYGMVGWAEWGVAGLGEICKSTSYQKIISLYRS